MKSTFVNNVHPGTLWLCHAAHATLIVFGKIEKGDFVIVLEITDLGFEGSVNRYVKIFSQHKGCSHIVSLEDFYFCYHKI